MKRIWILICLAACCAVSAVFLPINDTDEGKVLLVQDAFDPMGEVLEPYAENSMEHLNPYQLGFRLPGHDGMAFVFGTQARHYQERSTSSGYIPLYSATVVIAVNRNGNSAGTISGWRSLLESEAVVLIPQQATEGGRLTAIAIARALGAAEGDFTPALEALSDLNVQNRLNRQNEYWFPGYIYMYRPDRLPEHDAVVMWDYQTAMLTGVSADWDIIIPEEGAFTVDCGFVYGRSLNTRENLRRVKEFLLSEQGRQTLSDAGFSPLTGEAELSAWDFSRLTYNPDFRRTVLSVKLHGPASILERLLLQSVTVLLFCIAAQRILRRIPQGLNRATSFYAMLFAAIWVLIGIVKILSIPHELTRYLWFTTYIPRHILPVCWYCMCHMNRYGRLPSQKSLKWLGSIAVFLTLFVFTNDLHRQVFGYILADPTTWTNQYSYEWGYYLSLLWSFSLIIAGLRLFIHNNMTWRQKRQMLYGGVFFAILLVYQFSYIAGVTPIIDLDIPTTVAIFILVFNLAAQRERFMGASLLELPIFRSSPYAIAVYDGAGQIVYHNTVMESLKQDALKSRPSAQGYGKAVEFLSGEKVFKSREYTLDTGRVLVLEDITALKRLEQSLKETHKKLEAVQGLLVQQAQETRDSTGRLAYEKHSRQMDQLFREKLEDAHRQLNRICEGAGENSDNTLLRRIRFLLCICQQRLRFIIRSLETHPLLPAELIENYVSGVIRDGRRFGLDGVITAASNGFCPAGIIAALLESIDDICRYALDLPGSSLILRLEGDEAGITLNALLSWEGDMPSGRGAMLTESLSSTITGLGGQVCQETEEDSLLTRLYIPYVEVRE